MNNTDSSTPPNWAALVIRLRRANHALAASLEMISDLSRELDAVRAHRDALLREHSQRTDAAVRRPPSTDRSLRRTPRVAHRVTPREAQ